MNHFDNKLRQKIEDAEMPVAGGLWEAIESQIAVKKEPSRLWFLFLLGAFTLPMLLLIHKGSLDSDKTNVTESIAANLVKTQSALQEPGQTSQAIKDITQPQTATTQSSSTENTENQYEKLRSSDQVPDVTYAVTESVATVPFTNSTLNRIDNFSTTIAANKNSVEVQAGDHNNVHSASTIAYNDVTLPLTHIIKPIKRANPKNHIPLKNVRNAYKRPARTCPDFKGYNPGMYVFGEVNTAKSAHNLMPRVSGIDNYVDIRRDTELSALSYSAAVGIGYQFQNGMIAETGLALDNIRLKFDAQNSSIKNTTIIQVDTVINQMDTMIFYDTLRIFDTGFAQLSTHNTFRQVNIPLIVGYEFPLNAKLRMSVKGGVLINLVSMSKGQIIGQSDLPVLHFGKGSEDDVELYKTNVGFGYTGGLNLEADLSKNITVYAGANINYYPNSFSRSNNPVSQKFHKIGLTTGFKYRI